MRPTEPEPLPPSTLERLRQGAPDHLAPACVPALGFVGLCAGCRRAVQARIDRLAAFLGWRDTKALSLHLLLEGLDRTEDLFGGALTAAPVAKERAE